jgi:hypothetical protein
MRRLVDGLGALLLCAALSACGVATVRPPAAHTPGASLRFIGEQRLASRLDFKDTVVGGLSGIDYNPRSGAWIMESDDRSEVNPARFYVGRLDYDEHAFRSVSLTDVRYFRQADGTPYPGAATLQAHGGEVPDIEAVRYDPLDDSIWYSSEGDRKRGHQPFVRQASADGRLIKDLPMPEMLRVRPEREEGARSNQSFEGLAFAPDGRSLWLAMEAPLYQDGPVATPSSGAMVRISRFDRNGALLKQFAYPIEAIAHAPAPGRFADNGVSEILAIDEHHLYAIERSGVQDAEGNFTFYIKLFEVDLSQATDIAALPGLTGAAYTPARKRLVLDFATLRLPWVGNIEGMSWGPRLANGHESIVFVADDNFLAREVTQFLVFDVLP